MKHLALEVSLTHQSLDRGLRLLEAVASGGGAVSLAEAARRTGLHRSTAHHLLKALASLNYLRQDPGSRRYEVAGRLYQLIGQTPSPVQLGAVVQPFLVELTRRSGEGSSLAAYRDGKVIIVAKREHDGPVRVVQDVGAERPIHCSAVAKAIVAWLPEPELASLLARTRLVRYTPKTITARAEFEAELRRIRAAGCAIDDEEHIQGIRCMAAPVFGHAGHVVASMCVVGPKSRITLQKLRELRAPLFELSRALSEQLGWSPSLTGRRDGATRRPGTTSR